jgi:putative addiction module CopG family antidote
MTVTLPPELDALVQEKVEAGPYATPAEVIAEALRLLDERDRRERLRASLIEAEAEIDRGDSAEWTPDLMATLVREADELSRQGVQPDPDVVP